MIKIAHRGNQNGPAENENEPHQIVSTIAVGYNVEVDVWKMSDGIYFGHDEPKYLVDEQYLLAVKDEAWFHCKNLEALNFFKNNFPDFKYFWHQEDDYTLTSNGYIWTYPGQEVTENSIVVDLGVPDLSQYKVLPYAICSDYVERF